jgi:hypothetical protein
MTQFDSGRPDMTKVRYNLEWFKNRALSSIHKNDDGSWDFSDSLLLYLPKGAAEYESLQEEGTPYFQLVTRPEREYLEKIATQVATCLPDHFEYIDLGPGTEHKEQYLFDALKTLGKKFTYIPVDISEYFLKLAQQHASAQGIDVHPVQASFEELSQKLIKSAVPKFVSLGLTFSNYEPRILFELLSKIAGEKGIIFIDAHMRDRTDMAKLREVYDIDARGIVTSKFDLIGIEASKGVADIRTDERIQVQCVIKEPGPLLNSKGVKTGDTMLVFRSLRYTKESLENEIKKIYKKYKLFDTGAPFIGALLWNE